MSKEFLLERYKYVLDQKRRLNDNTFKVAAFYQSALIIILAGQFELLKELENGAISSRLADLGSIGLLFLLTGLSLVCITLLLGGVAAWLKYRRDEAEVESQVFASARKAPRWRDLLRWYETYIVFAILLTNVIFAVAVPAVFRAAI